MIDELRERMTAYLSQQHVCVICTSGHAGAWAALAQYCNLGLTLDCRLPRWSDALYHLEQDPHALVIVWEAEPGHGRWLQSLGTARIDGSTADARYVAVHITPERLDLIDESRSWGARETLDI